MYNQKEVSEEKTRDYIIEIINNEEPLKEAIIEEDLKEAVLETILE